MGENEKRKIYFIRKKILTIVLMAMLFAYVGFNIYTNREAFLYELNDAVDDFTDGHHTPTEVIADLEKSLTRQALGRMDFVEVASYANVILDKRESENFEYIKDEDGSLQYASFFMESPEQEFDYAMRILRLKEFAEAYGTDVLVVIAPQKYIPSMDRLRSGMPAYDPSEEVNEFMFYLNRLGIDTLDLGARIPNDEVSYEDAFFKTDHHWTVDAAFSATEMLVDTLNDNYGYDLDAETYLSRDMYTQLMYHQGMLGSMGRGTGACFSGLDDFNMYVPNFEMNFYRKTIEDDQYVESEGDMVGTLILPHYLYREEGIYKDSQYSVYLDGIHNYDQIINLDNPDGLKVFMVRDSYFSPVVTFMAPMCGEIDTIWSVEDTDLVDIEEYIRNNRFDCIILEYYPHNMKDEAFDYFMEAGE